MSAPVSAQEFCQSVRGGQPIPAARLNRVLRIDAARGLVEVQAGVRWQTLAETLRPGDPRAREVCSRRHAVGDSLAWNAAGPDGRPLVTHVESLALVMPEGQLRRLDRIGNPGLFRLVVGGQGLFGALYSLTLRIESLIRAVSDAQPVQSLEVRTSSRPASRLRLLVPPESLDGFLQHTRTSCREWRVPVEAIEVRPVHRDEETYLRWAQREYSALSLAFGPAEQLGASVRATQLRRELIQGAIAQGGTFPIACTREATRAQTQACYPQLSAFLAEHRRIDPGDRMANGWCRHYRNLLSEEAPVVRWNAYVAP